MIVMPDIVAKILMWSVIVLLFIGILLVFGMIFHFTIQCIKKWLKKEK